LEQFRVFSFIAVGLLWRLPLYFGVHWSFYLQLVGVETVLGMLEDLLAQSYYLQIVVVLHVAKYRVHQSRNLLVVALLIDLS
jgi:hypothetical protein